MNIYIQIKFKKNIEKNPIEIQGLISKYNSSRLGLNATIIFPHLYITVLLLYID